MAIVDAVYHEKDFVREIELTKTWMC